MLKRNNSVIQYSMQNSVRFGEVCFFMDVESIDKTVAVIDSFECTEQRLPVSHIVPVKSQDS